MKITEKKKYDRVRYLKNRDEILKITKKYNKNHRKEANERTKKWEQKIKKVVISYYSNGLDKCECCGEEYIEFLTIDHIKGDGNKHRKSFKTSIYSWLIKHNFPVGFRVLCMNCNFARRFGKKCLHEVKS